MIRVDSCGILIKHIHDSLEKEANNALRRYGLTMAQIGVLLTLNNCAGSGKSLKELEQILHVAQSTAAGIVVRLEQKGFVRAFGSPNDKRVKLVRITDTGIKCCEMAYSHMEAAEEFILNGLDAQERDDFRDALLKICSNLDKKH